MSFLIGLDISALDQGFKSHAGRGIGRYVMELKQGLEKAAHSSAVQVAYFDHCSITQRCGKVAQLACRIAEKLPAGRATFKQQLLYPYQLARCTDSSGLGRFNALHFPAQMDAPAWGMRDYVLTVLDLIPLVCADLYRANNPGARYKFARWLEKQAICNAALVLTISENTARDVNRIMGVPWEKLIVTPLGVDEKFFAAADAQAAGAIRQRLQIAADREIILYVGGIDPRKNYLGLLEAFGIVRQRRGAAGLLSPFLVMAGNIAKDREYPRLQAAIDRNGLQDAVVLLGFLADSDLLQLYAESSVFFFPSFYEGFGLPPLEAMATGVPVVSSNTSAMPEVLGEAALMVDPQDARACAEALSAVLENPSLAQELREKGRRRAALYTWDKTAALTLQAYERLIKK